jgi:TPR repeat protein
LDRDSCQNLGYHYFTGYGLVHDQTRSAALYHLGCDEDPGFNCLPLDHFYYEAPPYAGDEILEQWAEAAGAYVRACGANFAPGCFGMAKLIARSGNGVSHGEDIRRWLERAIALSPDYFMAHELMDRLDSGDLPEEPIL